MICRNFNRIFRGLGYIELAAILKNHSKENEFPDVFSTDCTNRVCNDLLLILQSEARNNFSPDFSGFSRCSWKPDLKQVDLAAKVYPFAYPVIIAGIKDGKMITRKIRIQIFLKMKGRCVQTFRLTSAYSQACLLQNHGND